jgi:uncharacterized SAM-binding protein YcdF (DUF218 family)
MMWWYDDCDDVVNISTLCIKQILRLSPHNRIYRITSTSHSPRSYLLAQLLLDVYGIHMTYVDGSYAHSDFVMYSDFVMDDESYTKFMLVLGNSI